MKKVLAMTTPDSLLSRIRGEYREMPGLRLTFAQACRLWDMEATTCKAVLEELTAERFLHQTADGAYSVFSGTRPTPAKATLSGSRRSAVNTRRNA